MGRRGANGEPFAHWHYRRLTLPDGDELQWVLIDIAEPPHVDAFRSASRGAIHIDEAMALLRAAGHPDADLDARIVPSFADPRGLSLGFISGGTARARSAASAADYPHHGGTPARRVVARITSPLVTDETDYGDGLDGIEAFLDTVELIPGVGPVIRYLIERIPMVQAGQVQRMLDRLLNALAESEQDLLARISRDERLRRLVSDAAHAAARSDSESKLIALARLVQSGIRDDAKLDEARFVIAIVDELQVIHVRALESLGALVDRQGEVAMEIAPALNVSEHVGDAIASHLVRLALAATPGISFSSLPSGVRISGLGKAVLSLLRDMPVDDDQDTSMQRTASDRSEHAVDELPPWWRGVHSEQIRIQRRIQLNDEPGARAVLGEAGFVQKSIANDDGTVDVEICAPVYADNAQPVYDAVERTLLTAGVDSTLVGATAVSHRHGLAYHRWETVRRDGQPLEHEGRPMIVLVGPNVDPDRVLDRYAAWLGCDRSALSMSPE